MRSILVLTFVALLGGTGAVEAQQRTTSLTGLGGANEALVWQAVGRLDTGTVLHRHADCARSCVDGGALRLFANLERAAEGRRPDFPGRAAPWHLCRGASDCPDRGASGLHTGAGFDGGEYPARCRLLRLETPIPTHMLDPFVLFNERFAKGPVSVVSYGRGRAELPSRQAVCRMFDRHQGVVLMDCDVTFGSSGAPVFSHKNGRGQIISVISSVGRFRLACASSYSIQGRSEHACSSSADAAKRAMPNGPVFAP
ncbi:MAG: hypothetical protein R8F89_12540 [Roseobacter sp.]|nr:hypothetical protein [Roseobacter sp.]MDW3182803.1 hypothetical protein [Roseobacter sp.]